MRASKGTPAKFSLALIITHFTHSVILPGIFADILIPVQDEES